MNYEQKPPKDLRIDLDDDDARFSNAGSVDTDAPPASTIYDPSVLALSPELRAKVAEREARNKKTASTESGEHDEDDKSPLHILSPNGNTQKNPFAVGKPPGPLGNGAAGSSDSEIELCCCGLLPVYPSLVVINVVNIVSNNLTTDMLYQEESNLLTLIAFGASLLCFRLSE